MIELSLTNSTLKVQIDNEDYERVGHLNWQLNTVNGTKHICTSIKHKTTYLGDLLIGAKEGFDIDHKDRDGLNYQKENLRYATRSQNCMNKEVRIDNNSGYKGVGFRNGKYRARIRAEGKDMYLGNFNSKIEAAEVYDKAAKKYFGEFAVLNFPGKGV